MADTPLYCAKQNGTFISWTPNVCYFTCTGHVVLLLTTWWFDLRLAWKKKNLFDLLPTLFQFSYFSYVTTYMILSLFFIVFCWQFVYLSLSKMGDYYCHLHKCPVYFYYSSLCCKKLFLVNLWQRWIMISFFIISITWLLLLFLV